jgi:hypothetical protein
MSIKDPLNQGDVINLKSIKKKLGLSLKQLGTAQAINKDDSLTADEKVRKFLNIPADQKTNDFLEQKLNQKEIITIKKFVKFED